MGNYNSLPGTIDHSGRKHSHAVNDFRTAKERHDRGRSVLHFMGNKLPQGYIDGLKNRLNDVKNKSDQCDRELICGGTKNDMNRNSNELNRYVYEDVLGTAANNIINDYQTRLDTAVRNNAKFKNYSNVYGGNVIPQGEIDRANTLIQNFRNDRSAGNAAQATTVDNYINTWNGLNNAAFGPQGGLFTNADNAKKAANEKIADLELYKRNFQGKANDLKNSHQYKNIDWFKGQYNGNPTNDSHNNLVNTTNELNQIRERAGYRAGDQTIKTNAENAIKTAEAKNATLDNFSWEYDDRNRFPRIDVQSLRNALHSYNGYSADTTHDALVAKTNEINGKNVPKVTPNPHYPLVAQNEINTAIQKNAQLQAYNNYYPNKFNDYRPLENEMKTYKELPTNNLHGHIFGGNGNYEKLRLLNAATNITPHANLMTNAENAKKAAEAKIADLALYGNFQGKANTLKGNGAGALGDFMIYYKAYNDNKTNQTHQNLETKTNELIREIQNAGGRAADHTINTNADNAKKAANEKIADLELYGNFQGTANDLKNSHQYKNIDWFKGQYNGNPTNETHVNLVNTTNELNQIRERAGYRAPNDQGLKDRATTAKNNANAKIADLELYGNFQGKANELKNSNAYRIWDQRWTEYHNYPANETHRNLENISAELKTATQNAGGRSADQNLINNANTAVGTADAKNKTLDNYVDYHDRNKYPRIDTAPLIAARDTYNVNPNNTTHNALVAITNEINGKNVAQITAHPHSLGLIRNEINTAIQKNAQLVAYSDAYGNVAQNDYKPLEAQLIAFEAKPNTPLHDVIFGINGNPEGNFGKVQKKNQNINITPSADLISKANTQLAAGRAKSEEYQKNPAYVNFVSSLTKPIGDCQRAKAFYENDQNNTTARNLVDTTEKLRIALGGVPTITTPKPTPIPDLLSKAEIQLDAADKLSKLLQNNPAYVNFVSTLNKPIQDCQTAYDAYSNDPKESTATNIENTTTALKTAIGGVPKITTPKPTPIQDLLTKADTQLDAGTALIELLKNNPAYASFATSLGKSVQDCQTAYDAYKNSPKESTANDLKTTTTALQTAINDVPKITTTPKPTPSQDLLKNADTQIKLAIDSSTLLKNNPNYASFANGLSTPIQECQAARDAYQNSPTDTTSQKLSIAVNTLQAAINGVPGITTPKPTPNRELLKNADIQIKLGNDLSTAFQNNKAYLDIGLGLNKIINECQTAVQAYTTNPTDTTAQTLVTNTNTLKTRIGEVPTITTPKPTSIPQLLENAGLQLDAGNQTIGLLKKNPAYTNVASDLEIVVKDCQTAYNAYDTNPNQTSADDLTSKTDKLRDAISKIPKVTTPVPTSTASSISFTSTPYASTPTMITTPYTSTPTMITTPYASTPYTSTPTTITTMYGNVLTSAVTLNPAADVKIVSAAESQVKIAEQKIAEIRNYPSLATKEPLGPDLDSLTKDVKSKLDAYKTNPNTDTTNALIGSTANLTKTLDSIINVPLAELIRNTTMYGEMIGSIISSAFTSPMPSITTTYGPTATMSPGSTYGPTATMSPGSTYGPTPSRRPGTIRPTPSRIPGTTGSVDYSTYGPDEDNTENPTYGPDEDNTENPTSSPYEESTYDTTTNITSRNRFITNSPITSLAYNAMDSVSAPRPTFSYENTGSVVARPTFSYTNTNFNANTNNYGRSCPTFNCANVTSAPTTFTSSCPTSNCAPYQTTVPPTTKPHKCQTCHSCRRCHCHRKTPTNR